MPAAEQELPNLLQRFEHGHSRSVIPLSMSKAMPKNRSVLAIRSVWQRRQCSDVNALTGLVYLTL
jgi:hypothetical protein